MSNAGSSTSRYSPSRGPLDETGTKLDPAGFLPHQIRNMCILAHVDHGKTTIADSVLTLSGIVQDRAAGNLRFMDNRDDERLRKITMKSSCVAIPHFVSNPEGRVPQLINLIDTPGHIDFENEINFATSLCDGALFVVDVVEGLTPQAKSELRCAYNDGLKVVLVLNKIDRLILELKCDGLTIFEKLWKLVADCNGCINTIIQGNPVETAALSDVAFSPQKGEVIFASGVDGWGFTLKDFAELFVHLIQGETVASLTDKLWQEDLYVSGATSTIKEGAMAKCIPNVFAQLISATLIHIYNKISVEEKFEEIPKILKKLHIDDTNLHLGRHSGRTKTKMIMTRWKSLGTIIARQCYEILPSPIQLDRCGTRERKFNRDHSYASCFYRSQFNRISPGTIEGKMRKVLIQNLSNVPLLSKKNYYELCQKVTKMSENAFLQLLLSDDDLQVMGLVRIQKGFFRVGQRLTIVNPFLDPGSYMAKLRFGSSTLVKVKIKDIYIPLGKEWRKVESLGCGYICGVSLTQPFPFPKCTIGDHHPMPIFQESRPEPIMYNVISPLSPRDSAAVRIGLQLLQHLDSSVYTFTNEMGEFILCTAGKVHLDKCLNDLRQNFVDLPMAVSDPIYSLRETITCPNATPVSDTIYINPNVSFHLEFYVTPIPSDILEVLKKYHSLILSITTHQLVTPSDLYGRFEKNEQFVPYVDKLLPYEPNVVKEMCDELGEAMKQDDGIFRQLSARNILLISDSESTINGMFNLVQNYNANMFITHNECDQRTHIFSSILRAFQQACHAGPICKERISNCAFMITKFDVIGQGDLISDGIEIVARHSVVLSLKSLFHKAFMATEITIMEPMVLATVSSSNAGKVCEVAARYFGRVLPLTYYEEENVIRAVIPARESDAFVRDVRGLTMGSAVVSCVFHGYEHTRDSVDPDEEEKRTTRLNPRADQLVKAVLQRKGMNSFDELLFKGEKQRTRKK
ncbi:hypothetical protein PPYR_05900 [Photinus pyralis]|uniref:Tr-type G domain-containing protein n=1 Tax=Photinus pyralis TaxID=7054 RepID=A0A1Y1LR88_PHOPY|nr:ribosome assembly protein 1-like [Photinus pyralis]KAB0801546.1 hypothetical protein PPYR_05900 [Photinus pyralis]